jgi:UDP-glucose 4-epimerase
MRRVLVTGAHGFIGRHVARRLAARGDRVTGLGHGDWDPPSWRSWGLSEWICADVTPEALAAWDGAPEVIIHCAGSASAPFSLADPAEDFRRTVDTTLAVLEFARLRAPGAALVLTSSAAVYGDVALQPIPVEAPLQPRSPYGVHKRMMEDLGLEYAALFGLRVARVRLFSVFGAGLRKQLLWDACRKLTAGETVFAGDGAETRDWLHVEDAAELLALAALHASPTCPVVNGGRGAGVSVREVLDRVAKRLGSRSAPRFTGVGRPGDPRHFRAEIDAALAWGWSPSRDLDTELDAYVDWYLQGGA